MKTLLKKILVLAFMCCMFPTQAQHLLLGGSGWNKIAIIEKSTREVVWSHPLEKGWECNNAVADKKGKTIVFTYKKGIKAITLDHKELWNIKAPAKCEMQSLKMLPNGNCLIAWNGHPLTIMEVKTKTGEVISKVEYETGVASIHGQTRQINKMKDGNYIVPIVTQNVIHIVSPEGKKVKEIKISGKPFATELIKDSVYLVAGGDGHSISEVDFATGKTLRLVKDGDVKGSPLFYVAGIEQNKDSFYVTNWQGHSKGKTGPKVLELDSDLNILWQVKLEDKGIGRISSISTVKYKKSKK